MGVEGGEERDQWRWSSAAVVAAAAGRACTTTGGSSATADFCCQGQYSSVCAMKM